MERVKHATVLDEIKENMMMMMMMMMMMKV
jgi:hypothetical protein